MINREALQSGTRPEIPQGQILLSRSDGFDGYEIVQYQGMCWGISVRSKDIGRDIMMGCKQITGGELDSYTQLSHESRVRAVDDLIDSAKRMGANGIINVLFEVQSLGQGGNFQVTVYGTAVVIRPIEGYVPTGAVGNILADIADGMSGGNRS